MYLILSLQLGILNDFDTISVDDDESSVFQNKIEMKEILHDFLCENCPAPVQPVHWCRNQRGSTTLNT